MATRAKGGGLVTLLEQSDAGFERAFEKLCRRQQARDESVDKVVSKIIEGVNVREASFQEIWMNSEVFRRLRNMNAYQGKCGRCEFRKVCGGCRARAYETSGDYMAEEPYCIYEPV